MYAEVLPNLTRLKTTFHYEVPSSLVNRLQAGHLVIVPFGRQRVQGVVLSCSEAPPAGIVEFNFHDLRHFAIKNMQLAGNDHFVIQDHRVTRRF